MMLRTLPFRRTICPHITPLSIQRVSQRLAPVYSLPARAYARYSRFEDEGPVGSNEGPEDPRDRDYRRLFEHFRLYGTAAVIAGGGTLWYVTHLEQVPETKRWRYMDSSKRMVKLLEKQAYVELMDEFGKDILPISHPATQLVQAVAETLISKNGLGHVVTRPLGQSLEQKPDEWLVYVVNQDIQNAFVMPGRKIVVFSGMLKQVADTDQLAGILSHEVAHQLIGHVIEKFMLGTNTNIAGIALQALVALPNSRTQELEADLVGLRLMSKACFEPEAVVKFWRSFDLQDKRQPPQILSTHPGHRQRAAAIEGWIPSVRSEYPCVNLLDFSRAFTDLDENAGKPSLPPSRTLETPQRTPSRQPKLPSPPPQPEGDVWGTQDPWASGSSSGYDSEADWGTEDPWAKKQGVRRRDNSW